MTVTTLTDSIRSETTNDFWSVGVGVLVGIPRRSLGTGPGQTSRLRVWRVRTRGSGRD